MARIGLHLYYKNVTSIVIGQDHGITHKRLEDLAKETSPFIVQVNRERLAGRTLYRELPYNEKTGQRVKELARELKARCENLVIFGIGGSALGNIALSTALRPFLPDPKDKQSKKPQLFVLDNVDPDQFGSFLDYIKPKLRKTVFNVISKSGRTSETAAQFMIIREMLIDALGKTGYQKHVVATTNAKAGTLRTIANNDKLEKLEVPEGVGGRFSVLSAVGLFSAAMCGIDIDTLLAGARDMDKRVKCEDFYENPAAINAAINYHFYNRGKRMSVMMPYAYALKDMADWYRQLWAESLGKARDLADKKVEIGPTPINALGTTDQHSQVQLYREGPNDKLFTFLQVNNFDHDPKIGPAPDCAPELGFLAGKNLGGLLNKHKKATEYALLESKRPCLTVLFDKVDAYTVGQFIYLYEVTTSLAGALFNINPYDQPAVELGKEATFALMGKEGYEAFAQEIQSKTEIDEDYLV